jgi:Ca2+/Na+ antiporter
MKRNIFSILNEPKTKIDWVHGVISCIGSFIICFLIMSSIPVLIIEDFAYKTIPLMILTPILITLIATWLLLSKSYFKIIKKILYLIILYLLIVSLKEVI